MITKNMTRKSYKRARIADFICMHSLVWALAFIFINELIKHY